MSFADLFARYREMGAMGPQPLDGNATLLNEASNSWTLSLHHTQEYGDGDGVRQERNTGNTSRPLNLSSDVDYANIPGESVVEELLPSSPRLNLGLLKNNSVCKEYYKLTSNVLRSLIGGIKEIAKEDITPAWQVGVRSSSPKKSFSNKLVCKLHEDSNNSNSRKTQMCEEVESSRFSSPFVHPSNLPMREVVNIADLRRWLWAEMGHPMSYLRATPPKNLWNNENKIHQLLINHDSQELETSEDVIAREVAETNEFPCEPTEQLIISKSSGQTSEVNTSSDSTKIDASAGDGTNSSDSSNIEEPAEAKAEEQTLADVYSSSGLPNIVTEDEESRTKQLTDSDSDQGPLVRKPRRIDQPPNDRSPRGRQSMDIQRIDNEVNRISSSTSQSSRQLIIRSMNGEYERQVSSNRTRQQHQQLGASHNEVMIPSRPRSWCIVGGYVRRFPTKHHNPRGMQPPPSKRQPQVPLAA